MAAPANPLDNKEAISQMGKELRESMSFLLGEFVRPTMLQTKANAEAIDRISEGWEETQAIVQSNARAIAAEGDRVRELRESVEVLYKSSDDTAAETSTHEERIAANEQRFETLLAEARADREAFKAELQTMREESDRRFDAQMTEIRALGEQNRALLSALATTNSRVDQLERAS